MHGFCWEFVPGFEGRNRCKSLAQLGLHILRMHLRKSHMNLPKVRYEKSDNPNSRKRQALTTENPVGLRVVSLLGERDLVWLSRETGIPVSTLSDSVLKGISKADNAVKIAEAFKVSVDHLLTGRPVEKFAAAPVAAIDDAEWEDVPLFDLRNITDTGKGEPQSWTPFRKDWLNRSLGTSFDLYLVRLLSDYRSRLGDRDLAEGDLVFVREITPGELVDGHVVIWRREGGLKVARYALAPRDREDGDVIYPGEVSDDQFVPICRIYGKYLQRI